MNKLERLIDTQSIVPTRCFVSKSRQTIIDEIHPNTGLTVCFRKDLAACREEYPDAEEMSIDEFCSWKAEQQRTPIKWEPTTEQRYHEMLEVLPPALMVSGGFLVGEPFDHDAGNGQPRFQAFRHRESAFEIANRPMTRSEFRAAVGAP